MKKKKIYTLLSSLLCIGLMAGCSSKTQENEVQTQEVVAENNMESTSEEMTEIQEDSTEQVEEENVQPPKVFYETIDKKWWSEDGSMQIVDMSYQRVSVEGEGYEEVSQAIADMSEQQEKSLLESGDYYASLSQSDMYYYEANLYSSARIDNDIISLLKYQYYYNSGTENGNSYYGYNYDAQTGKLLSLEDVLSDFEGFKEAATEEICYRLSSQYGRADLKDDYEDMVADMWDTVGTSKWFLNASGITFIFDSDEAQTGAVMVTVCYNGYLDYIKPEYVYKLNNSIAKLPTEGKFVYTGTDLDIHSLILESRLLSEYGDYAFSLKMDGTSEMLGEYIYLKDAYILRKENGCIYLLITMDMASDDFVTYVYDISDGTLKLTDKISDVFLSNTPVNTQNLQLSVQLDVLGSYVAVMDYKLDDSGKLIQQGDVFQFSNFGSEGFCMTTKKELPVVLNSEETVLPIGTKLCIIGTDNKGTAYFRLKETEQEGMIHYTLPEDSWGCYIDGVQDTEYFDMVPYAG